MKTKIEVNGYEIAIEEVNGVISVIATKDEEVVEEFSIETEEVQEGEESQDGEDLKSFDKFGKEEEVDFEEGEEEIEEEMEDLEESKLVTFDAFLEKNNK